MPDRSFTAADCGAALTALKPHIRELVIRFGQGQADDIISTAFREVCSDLGGEYEAPRFVRIPGPPLDS
jgi:hypothetical protein